MPGDKIQDIEGTELRMLVPCTGFTLNMALTMQIAYYSQKKRKPETTDDKAEKTD